MGNIGEGNQKLDEMGEKTKKRIGCREMHTMRYEVRELFREEKGNGITARELIQNMTMTKGCKNNPMPGKVEEGQCMPEKPHVYSDGSVKNPRGLHRKVGGVGVSWQNRDMGKHPLAEGEELYTHHQTCGEATSLWTCFNDTQNSSTR